MAIVVHIVNAPKSDVREAYEASWTKFDEHGVRHPSGRQSHTAWLVGDVLRVVDVWASEEDMNTFMRVAMQVIDDADMTQKRLPASRASAWAAAR